MASFGRSEMAARPNENGALMTTDSSQVWLVVDDNIDEGGINDVLSAHRTPELADAEKKRLEEAQPRIGRRTFDVIEVPLSDG